MGDYRVIEWLLSSPFMTEDEARRLAAEAEPPVTDQSETPVSQRPLLPLNPSGVPVFQS